MIANSGSYGIIAEIAPPRSARPRRSPSTASAEPFTQAVDDSRRPGRYCFPPLAACITAAARLMLALLERLRHRRGGSYAFCDTDSMAIVATEHGG